MCDIENAYYGNVLNINGKYYFNYNNKKVSIYKLGKFSEIYKNLNFNYYFILIDSFNFIDTIKIKNVIEVKDLKDGNVKLDIYLEPVDDWETNLDGNLYMVYKIKNSNIYILNNY